MKIHIMGCEGSGAKAVAFLAEKYGYEVTGCDAKTGGHDVGHLEGVDLLVVSPAILYKKKAEPEMLQGKKKNILMTWEEFVGKYLMKDKYIIAIAGTHGKSTTTAMVGQIMEDAGLDPTVLVGANVPKWGGNARYGKSKYFVVEADEFNDNFLHYNPDIIAINNIEFDHPDYFKDEKQLKESFDKFIKNLKPNGKLITRSNPVISFNLRLMGNHNQENANMAYQVARKLGINNESITKSLENFEGIGRRMELIGEGDGAKVYSDYAHHPTAIKTTLEGLRDKYKKEKILAIIEPHGYKRTKALLPLYKNVFNAVDSVIIGPIFKARDEVDSSISSGDIVKISNHVDIQFVLSVDLLIKNLKLIKNYKLKIQNYDIVVVMGAGNSNLWAQQILKTLQH